MPEYEVRLLGTFRCLYEGKPLQRPPKGRQLLLFVYLLLHADTPVNRKSLVFCFWPDSEEVQALTNLRKLIHDFKKILHFADSHLEAEDGQLVWRTHGCLKNQLLVKSNLK